LIAEINLTFWQENRMKFKIKMLPVTLIAGIVLGITMGAVSSPAQESADKTYIGSEACAACHEGEYETFSQHARKAKSFHSVEIMKKGLTPEKEKGCYKCHTTGYGQPGGFVSAEKTPHLKNTGCEVCHGPGSVHAESEDPEDIIYDISMDSCLTCHNSERVAAFKFKPLLFGGAH